MDSDQVILLEHKDLRGQYYLKNNKSKKVLIKEELNSCYSPPSLGKPGTYVKQSWSFEVFGFNQEMI